MNVSQPKIFISSTIYDFRDLRSALKYWLEQMGYEVLLSEFNDFTKPLDQNSYNACLKTVANSDYYILFIGSRVGGFYNKSDKVSITRMEYRAAYKSLKSNGTKVVIFVREDLWAVKQDRKALEDFLKNEYVKQKELSAIEIQKISNYSSDIVNDAEAIFDFIDEVSRAEEMKKAVEVNGELPIGNWIHKYSSFQDVIDVLNGDIGITDRLSSIALK
jgi:hypothetical protein